MSLATLQGEPVVLCFDDEAGRALLADVLRLEEAEGRVAKITDYYFAPDTVSAVASELGVGCKSAGYHQPPQTLVDMIATTGAPWIAA